MPCGGNTKNVMNWWQGFAGALSQMNIKLFSARNISSGVLDYLCAVVSEQPNKDDQAIMVASKDLLEPYAK